MTTELVVSFEGVSAAQASQDAADLAELINRVAPQVETQQRRIDPDAQDFGATLILVLGTPAVIALAKGIADWMKARQATTTTLIIRGQDGKPIVEIDGMTSGDTRALLEGKLSEVVGR